MANAATKAAPSSWLNRCWRVLATGGLFALFGVGGLLLSCVWFNLLRLVVRDSGRRHQLTQDAIRHSFRVFLSACRFFGVFDYAFEHEERLQEDAGCLVIANHPSLLDYVLLASRMPRCDCIVKQALLRNVFVRGVIKAAGYLANAESERLLALCQQRLASGGTILIFPEGTRTTPGSALTLQRGAANIAIRSQCPIRLVQIRCEPPMLTKQGKWYNIPAIKPQFRVTVLDKIDTRTFMHEDDVSPARAARRLTQHLTDALQSDSINNEK
ncbi:acylglycerophosphoethanolamine acyltransferase [Serratia rubidaea]|uniref:Acylglycerophosphoethanolamine acyltransferase n=1 Tax=Serratia rubidaea TaxID=61652 RepID=A0A4U9HAN1_SERRU|nr:lysophospholipid acyltransferase family protein [Serratia rubidaea]MBD8450714.1 1-acyl-sn-glycerol-3-phosphate acyltransferase [Serratia rubidaea]MBS0975220.1 1-acyl-sn-glycerol-3-phosphate acyltransferase [Serratia rubidaea]MDK1703716.1 lysophospholipid acyltransferase family protein [Serratia rubidaea]QPR65760.1 1-acyl-sn-glycerol-3-phosphate acyltransferase [Serratia rubidaea]CAI1165623.1 acylglycerophosphoethanolamine acyltransferase [Serratia rubidaea]